MTSKNRSKRQKQNMCQGSCQGTVAHDHMTIPEPAFYLASGKINQGFTSGG